MAPVFVDGEKTVTLKGERIAEEFQAIVEDYVRTRYAAGAPARGTQRKKTIGIASGPARSSTTQPAQS